jgi:hypothetical protein
MTNQIIDGPLRNLDDYTFYVSTKDGAHLLDQPADSDTRFSREMELTIRGNGGTLTGRALVCRCFQGDRYSITIRCKSRSEGMIPVRIKNRIVDWEGCNYKPKETIKAPFCVSLASVCQCLASLIFPSESLPRQGVLLVAGGTNSAKSKVAEGIIWHYLKQYVTRGEMTRQPHLITVEDPIEHPFISGMATQEIHAGVDYTPRLLGSDVKDLAAAFHDAKRQTPTVFYVGEVRDRTSMAQVLDFAGSGHLVVTTAHAGSLTEAVQHIFTAVQARTPATRGMYAQRLLAVIHQRPITHRATNRDLILAAPALWMRTDAGIAQLVSDGLASVLPHNFRDKLPPHTSSVGRYWFAKNLLPHRIRTFRADQWRGIRDSLLEKARNLDLRGL